MNLHLIAFERDTPDCKILMLTDRLDRIGLA